MRKVYLIVLSLLLLSGSSNARNYTLISDINIANLNPAQFNKDFSAYHQKTAMFCAELSDMAYLAEGDIIPMENLLNQTYGIGTFKLVNVEAESSNTRALICAIDNFIVVAFRGTDFSVLDDIITDLKIMRYVSSKGADKYVEDLPAGHAGFREGSINLIRNEDFFEVLSKTIKERSGTADLKSIPVYLTGHSMGAAYASLFVQPVARYYKFGGAYNFAPPLAVSIDDAESLEETYGHIVYDLVNYKDYVPRAGRSCRKNMMHFGKFMRISKENKLYEEKELYVRWTRKEFSVATMKHYHRIAGYINAVGYELNDEASILKRKLAGEVIFSTDKGGDLVSED